MKRLISVTLSAICMLLLFSSAVCAITSQPPNLTVIMKYGDVTLSGIDVAVCLVADAKEEGDGVAYTVAVAFSGTGADFTDLTAEKNIALAAMLDTYACANSVTRSAIITDSDGRAVFIGLSAGLYLVAQRNAESSEYAITPYLVAVPSANPHARNSWNYDVVAYPKTGLAKHDDGTISVSVYKIVVGAGNHPDSIEVQLYRNGNPHGAPTTLSIENYWHYTWVGLSPDDTWTVDEISVPVGYRKTISGNVRSGFIITDTRNTQEPTPGIPGSPGTPAIPSIPGTLAIPGTPDASTQPNVAGTFVGPKTEDIGNMRLWAALIAAGCVGILAVVWVWNSKRIGNAIKRRLRG